MALTINEQRYQEIRARVLEQQAGKEAQALVESQQAPVRFETVEAFMAYLDTLTE